MMTNHNNPFLIESIPRLYLRTALPIIVVFLVNGVYNLVNAFFVGRYLGEAALSAITLVFPAQMLIFAFATLFSSGMASILARRIGARDLVGANRLFSNVHILVLSLFGLLGLVYALVGHHALHYLIGDLPEITALGEAYISILVYCSPILGILVLNTDALRSEGRVKFMSSVMLLSALLNTLLDTLFIAKWGLGIAAAAYATVLAQVVSLGLITTYRMRGKALLSLNFADIRSLPRHLAEVFPLGIPMSLSHIGVALAVGVVNHALMVWSLDNYQTLAGAYGIVLRLMTFAILPLIGISVSLQTILGNNYGAKLHERVDATFRFGLQLVFIYCVVLEVIILLGSGAIASLFVTEGTMATEATRIARFVVAAFVLFGPVLIVSSYFQAIGQAKQAIVLSLAKNYLFLWPLVMALPLLEGEPGIWMSFPAADVMAGALALLVFRRYSSRTGVSSSIPAAQ
ncbi:MAG TPA: MATE family efflux transporter [Gammaproteobacteria bacterium]